MALKSTNSLKLNSSAEETDWYVSAEGRKQTLKEFERALKDGTLILSPGLQIPPTDPDVLKELLAKARANATRPISIRLSGEDIELAKDIASKRGSRYQTVLQEAIHKGLKEAV